LIICTIWRFIVRTKRTTQ
jgi:hypothetical protein